MGFFKKLNHGASRFFKKAEHGANNAFKKIGHGINEVGDFAENAVDKVAGAGKQVGNFLEKNSETLGLVGAGLSTALGAPEFAPAILAASSAGKNLGGRVKAGSNNALRLKNKIADVRDRATDFNNNLNNAVQSALNQGRTTSQNMLNQSQNAVNPLGQVQVV